MRLSYYYNYHIFKSHFLIKNFFFIVYNYIYATYNNEINFIFNAFIIRIIFNIFIYYFNNNENKIYKIFYFN